MPDSGSAKKRLFLSHIVDEHADANRVKEWLERTFGENVEVFLASSWESIPPGDDWFKRIEDAIHDCSLMLLLASSESVLRPWILFETGAAWFSKKKVVPICYKGMTPSALPEPIRRLQAVDVNSTENPSESLSLAKLVEAVRVAADLPVPRPVSLEEVRAAGAAAGNASLRSWMMRPKAHQNEEFEGVFKVGDVDSCDPNRAAEAGVDAEQSLYVRLYIEPTAVPGITYFNTIAPPNVASFFEQDDIIGKTVRARVKLVGVHVFMSGGPDPHPVQAPLITIKGAKLVAGDIRAALKERAA